MIIYKDVCTGDEVFSDAFKLISENDDFIIGVCGKMEKRSSSGISASMIGGNASEEAQDEDCDDGPQTESGIDVVLNHRLEDKSDYFVSKKILQSYLKKFIKNAVTALSQDEVKGKERADKFKKGCGSKGENLMKFADKWTSDASVYTGASFDPEDCKSSVLIGVWNEDGMSITFYALKDCLEEEKQ